MDLKAAQRQRSSGILKSRPMGELPKDENPNEYHDTVVVSHSVEVNHETNNWLVKFTGRPLIDKWF